MSAHRLNSQRNCRARESCSRCNTTSAIVESRATRAAVSASSALCLAPSTFLAKGSYGVFQVCWYPASLHALDALRELTITDGRVPSASSVRWKQAWRREAEPFGSVHTLRLQELACKHAAWQSCGAGIFPIRTALCCRSATSSLLGNTSMRRAHSLLDCEIEVGLRNWPCGVTRSVPPR